MKGYVNVDLSIGPLARWVGGCELDDDRETLDAIFRAALGEGPDSEEPNIAQWIMGLFNIGYVKKPRYDETYTTGTGQELTVHNVDSCALDHCVIHNPSDHSMRDLPTHWRADRRIMERICEHGVGHPDPDSVAYQREVLGNEESGVHGCDGCCR